ncbi:hypothetical protein OQA88_3152 [Cercophora sp. LCS_1]
MLPLLFLLQGALALPSPVPLAIPNRYIITLKPNATITSHLSLLNRRTSSIDKTYSIADFSAYSGTFDATTLHSLSLSPDVATIEPDQIYSLSTITTQPSAPWGLASISHRSANQTSYLYDSLAGTSTTAYIIDTGIQTTHSDFEGRATWGYNAYPDSSSTDNHGHGTHVAGTVGGVKYGVAKKASLVAVKVFDTGSSTTSIVMDGFNWAVDHIISNNIQDSSVISMSLGGPYSPAFNTAVQKAWELGIVSVVAAGNEGQDASGRSPAGAEFAVTVGAVDVERVKPWWSNYGASVDVFAPGVGVESAWIGGDDNAKRTIDGTSMATPHVSGLVLYLRSVEGLKGARDVVERLKGLATRGVVSEEGVGSPNLLAYNGVEE